jgi:DNA-binding NarL/FixJ family response regulator
MRVLLGLPFGKPIGGALLKSLVRVLVVDDFEPWRSFYCSTLLKESKFEIVGEVSDGLAAVQAAQQLQPDLILLDIGLPSLNGIEAARRIRVVSANSKILFVSENHSADIVNEALSTGAGGYVLKSDAAVALLSAIYAVLEDKPYVSPSVARDRPAGSPDPQTGARVPREKATVIPIHSMGSPGQHQVGFYTDDARLLQDLTQFVGMALKAGNAAIVVATEPHRTSLVPRLKADGVDLDAALEQGRYIALDAPEALLEFMVNGMPDQARFLELLDHVIAAATEAAKGRHPCVSVFGECGSLLWHQGNADAAIQLEKFAIHITKVHSVNILCAYSLHSGEEIMNDHLFQQICAEHSAVHSQ